ncbi:MAG: hypothetical protein JEZ06_15630 [Anaerolineaceae bacterium]|nr:hypothetical protein [Anaerolineaceae bacterium]
MSKNNPPETIERPIGVWALCVFAVVLAGILPILSAFVFFPNEVVDPISLALSLLINLGVIFFAFRTWQGVENGRKAFLIFVTLNYVMLGANNLILLVSGEIPADLTTQFFGPVLRGIFYPILFIWYFNKPETREYFK